MGRLASSLLLVAAGFAAAVALRRLSVRSGATDTEVDAPLPGDEVIPHPMVEWNRAVTVRATPEQIWPWLVQRGWGRAGWYTPRPVDALLDRLLFRVEGRADAPPDGVDPRFQRLEVGEIVADGPDYGAYFRVTHVDPPRALVYWSIRHPWRANPVDPTSAQALRAVEDRLRAGGVYLDFTWAFVLIPEDDRTRLLVRTRSNYAPRWMAPAIPLLGLFDATYGMAMLHAIRRRVEATAAADGS